MREIEVGKSRYMNYGDKQKIKKTKIKIKKKE